MVQIQPQGRPSLTGRLVSRLIAYGVQRTGGNVFRYAQQKLSPEPKAWTPPRGWLLEDVTLRDGGRAQYLVPPGCTRSDTAILYVHGGGYTLGLLPFFKRHSVRLARLGGRVPIYSLDYRTAPEHPYPAALDDAMQAIAWLEANKGIRPEALVAVGESAGAGLILAIAMRLRDENRRSLRALVLMSPWTDLTGQSDAFTSRYTLDPMFGSRRLPQGRPAGTPPGHLYAGSHDARDPYVSPAFGHYEGLPPMLVHVGENEILHDDAVIVSQKAEAAGVPAELKVWSGMFHAFQLADPLLPEARRAWREIGRFVRQHLTETRDTPS